LPFFVKELLVVITTYYLSFTPIFVFEFKAVVIERKQRGNRKNKESKLEIKRRAK